MTMIRGGQARRGWQALPCARAFGRGVGGGGQGGNRAGSGWLAGGAPRGPLQCVCKATLTLEALLPAASQRKPQRFVPPLRSPCRPAAAGPFLSSHLVAGPFVGGVHSDGVGPAHGGKQGAAVAEAHKAAALHRKLDQEVQVVLEAVGRLAVCGC